MDKKLPSKSSVRKAGKRISEAGSVRAASKEDIDIVDNWRKAHLKPLTAISMWLRKPSQETTGLSPAQRLKRLNTVLDKLISGRSKDAATMQDLGGCRLIFGDLQALSEFRHYLEKGSRARHELLHYENKYDYIASPKETGYRGVHYVYGYRSSSEANAHLDGLERFPINLHRIRRRRSSFRIPGA
ncbi:RelA/SpoT domain-containing protein [Psychromarinibacter sp. C21-152]|uniref:RelA/SpoT domain-containing protein n=1 Tax=Psychromarinibacter sediminicola TaxID=3033385 RepID=A0AAE3NXD0_9RHOB|nr:RelA/SpoT domain-containing protein [Psychromarinibacter sediminicola]MDF0603979.1 RelA/SpoT domain-containing protein [Psychromarinibacter sediminicola]